MWILKQYADNIAHGSLPYVGFHPEYPPFAFIFIYLPYLIEKNPIYYLFWYGVMVTIAICIGAFVIWLWKRSMKAVWPYLFLLFLMQASDYKLVYENFDIFVSVLTLIAVYLFYKARHEALGWFVLFIATMTKFYPGILALPFFLQSKNKWSILWFLAPGVALNTFLIWVSHGQYLQFMQTQGFRPAELNGIPAAVMIGLHFVKGIQLNPIYIVNSWGLTIPKETLNVIRLAIGAVVLVPFILVRKRILQYHPARIATILITAFLLVNIVLSPGYLTWLIPFIPFLDDSEILLFTACAFVTSGTFIYWNVLWGKEPMNEWLLLTLFTKAMLLFVFYGKLFFKRSEFNLLLRGFTKATQCPQTRHIGGLRS